VDRVEQQPGINRREIIPLADWGYLRVAEYGKVFIARPFDGSAYNTFWHELRFSRDGILKAFPENGAPLDAPATPIDGHSPKETASGTSKAAGARGAKERGVLLAIEAIWPNGRPLGLAAKERDAAIIRWLRENGHSTPDPRTIRRVINQ
jgi:hypothetical protein